MESLDEIISVLGPNHQWTGWWERCRSELVNIDPDDVGLLYKHYRKMESSFGGMGTFNDQPHSDAIIEAAKVLCCDIAEGLKDCWRLLGNEHHPDGKFELYQAGTQVHLVRGSVLMLNRDGEPEYADFVTDHLYTVNAHIGADITNMPIYHLSLGQGGRPARHLALRLG